MFPVILAVVAVAAGVSSVVAAERAEDDAEANLDRAKLQSALYGEKAARIEMAATVEAEQMYQKAGEVSSRRQNTIAARGININSQIAEQMDERDQIVAFNAVSTMMANAAIDASSMRTTGRLAEGQAKDVLDSVESQGGMVAFLGGSMPYLTQMGTG